MFRRVAVAAANLVATLILTAAGAADTTNEVALPPYRYLFLIDTSAAMARQKEIAIDTVRKLILSEISGRIRTGDTLGIWTFSDKIRTNAFRALMWVPTEKQDFANRASRFLRDQRFAKKARLDEVAETLDQAARASGALTVFLLTDGSSPLSGTPFDDPVNEIFKKHATGMRKSKKPFVVVFVALEGRVVTHAVSPGGGPIYIPRAWKTAPVSQTPPKREATPAPNKPTPAPKLQPQVQPPVQAPTTNPPKALSVEEISAELVRQAAQKRSNAVTTAPRSPTPPARTQTPASTPAPLSAQPPPIEIVETDATAPPLNLPAEPAEVVSPTVKLLIQPKEQAGAQSQPPQTARQEDLLEKPRAVVKETQLVANLEPARESPEPPSGGDTPPPLRPDSATELEPAAHSPPKQPLAVALAGQPGSSPRTYLLLSVVLLAVAAALLWAFFRHARPPARPSLISQSMDREKGVNSKS